VEKKEKKKKVWEKDRNLISPQREAIKTSVSRSGQRWCVVAMAWQDCRVLLSFFSARKILANIGRQPVIILYPFLQMISQRDCLMRELALKFTEW